MTHWTFYSLMLQLARLSALPTRRAKPRPRSSGQAARECCGCCPRCGAFVAVAFGTEGAPRPCPACGRAIRGLEPPGSV
jgi:hypothetical protein